MFAILEHLPTCFHLQTTDFLRYYIVPRMLMTASMDDGDTLITDLGIDHQLIIKEHGWKKVRATLAYLGPLQSRVAQSEMCLITDVCLTSDPGVISLILARSHTFVEIDHEIMSTVILLPSTDSFK